MTNLQKGIKYGAIAFGIMLIVGIASAILSAVGIIDIIVTGGSEGGESFTETYQDVHSIDIDVHYSDILIESGDDFRVDATNVSRYFSSSEKNGTLKIKEKRNWFWMGNSFGRIVVTIPTDTILRNLEIDSGAGKIEIDKIVADQLEISQGAGVLKINEGDFLKTNIDGGAGKIDIDSSMLNNLDLDAGVGNIDIEAMLTGNSDIDSGVGEINLKLLGTKEDYRIHVEKGVGSIQIDGENYSKDASFGSGNNRIEIDGGVGSITVDFSSLSVIQ